jgi:NAD(P)-dependent dehydrogenase (short-subunit alcohol dehydrogenase family)
MWKACKVQKRCAKGKLGTFVQRATILLQILSLVMADSMACLILQSSCQHPGSPTDVTNETALTALFDFARETFSGPPDVVVVNAGISEIGNFTQDVVESKLASPSTGLALRAHQSML